MNRYTKVSGNSLNFRTGERLNLGTNYALSEIDLPKNQISIRTHLPGRVIESALTLEGSDNLNFTIKSDDPALPNITGKFLDKTYFENIVSASMPAKNLNIAGSVTRLSESTFVSIKTLTSTTSGEVIAVIQELVELISESQFGEGVAQLTAD